MGLGDEGDVVIVQCVGHRAVDQRGLQGGGLEAAPDDGGRRYAAQRSDVVAQHVGQRLAGAG